jgi:hypothetical protein
MSAERNCFNVVNLRGEFVDIGAPHMGSHGQDGAVHITGYNTAKIHMESETKHVAGTQIVQAKDNNSDVIFSTDNGNRTLGFDANCTVDFNNCTVQNLAGGGGGAVSDPLNLNNINASIGITTPILTPPAGQGLVITANGLQPTEGGTLNISATTVGTVNGDISTMNGNLQVQGTGAITCATTITANGDIGTQGTGDIVSGRNIYFDGVDLYKRTLVGGVPSDTSYVIFQNLAVKSNPNTFTSPNTFADNIVMSGTGKSFTNSGGTVSSNTANIATTITCGTVNCDNGGVNKCSAKEFATRTSSASTTGWAMKQDAPSVPAVFSDNALQFTASQAGSFITVASSDHDPSSGDFPSIIIDPATVADGGRISCAEQIFGTTANRFIIKQDNGGVLDNHLQINAGSASSEVRFRDDGGQSVLRVAKSNVILGSTIPLSFGAYSFRPIQYYRDVTAFSFNHDALGATNQIFTTNSNDWTNKNTGATNQTISMGVVANRGAYKLTFAQTSAGTLGQINDLRLMSDIVLTRANDNAPNIVLPSETTYSFEAYDGTAPIITMKPGSFVYNVYATFPQVSGNETSNIRITLTQMPYFA